LAKRTLKQADLSTSGERISWLFATVTCRPPSEAEQGELEKLLIDALDHYRQQPDAASKLSGTSGADEAAWTIVASTLLNLDEVVSK